MIVFLEEIRTQSGRTKTAPVIPICFRFNLMIWRDNNGAIGGLLRGSGAVVSRWITKKNYSILRCSLSARKQPTPNNKVTRPDI
jgi:hypothetical protein